MPIDIQAVLAHYPAISNARATPLGNAGGFSGAKFWQLALGNELFCLRRWPAEHPTKQHLRWIHDLLAHVYQSGVHFVPVPIPTSAGQSICDHGGHQWEIAPWMPGRADFCETGDNEKRQTRLVNAMAALALFHHAAATFQMVDEQQSAPGIEMRLRRHQELCNGKLEQLRRSVAENRAALPTDFGAIANQLLDGFSSYGDLRSELQQACRRQVTLQPCIRDIWHDHVLFSEDDASDQVTGIVDFGAARIAAREGDIARLLGSLVGSLGGSNRDALWNAGLEAYQTNGESFDEQLVQAWHRANVSMSGLQWVEWLFWDARVFENLDSVRRRLDSVLTQLKQEKP